MSEMVDRVAQYLLEHCNSGHDEDDVHWDDLPDKAKALIRQTSRVMIAAMREPTSAMIEMVSDGMYHHFTTSDAFAKPLSPKDIETLRYRLRKAAIDNWRAMIDAALKE